MWRACCSRSTTSRPRPRGVTASGGRRLEALAWSAAARVAVLEGYREAGRGCVRSIRRSCFALEVEKEWRELAYAARVLPEWLYAPRLVSAGAPRREPEP